MENINKKASGINIKDSETVENFIVFKNSQTVRTLVMLCVSFNVGLILAITIFGLFWANDKDAIMQMAFMAVSSFASNIGAIVIVAFMEINKPENSQSNQNSNETN